MKTPAPDLPDHPVARTRSNIRSLVRVAAAHLMAVVDGRTAAIDVVREHWPDMLTKTATSPATITGAGWASQLAGTQVPDFLLNLGGASSGIFKRGASFTFNSSGAIQVPGVLADADNAGFVAPASPIRVLNFSIDSVTLAPRKFAAIVPFTREIFTHSVPSILTMVEMVLNESVSLATDKAAFDNSAGDATRPPGLAYGISALGTVSSNTIRNEAMQEDLTALAASVATVAGGSPIIFVAAPPQYHAIKLWARGGFAYEVLCSSALADGVVLAVASNCIVSAIAPAIRLDVSDSALLHMEFTSPLAIASGSTTTPIPSAPLRSLWQTSGIGLRVIFDLAWGLRSANGLAWAQNVIWGGPAAE